MTLTLLKKELKQRANPSKKEVFQSFFKTGPGEYGEGDIFLGISVPQTRIVAKKYQDISLSAVKKLLYSKIHEERLCAVIILTLQYQQQPKKIFEFYLQHATQINNWDLVDVSAPHIVGQYLLANKKERDILTTLAKSTNLWKKRISIVATHTFIKQGKYKQTLKLCEELMSDSHDLIHKACGWMLREVGKHCSEEILEKFLIKHIKTLPRTTLRYAIERFSEPKRKALLAK